jgi:hypothetical protein
VHVKQDLWTSLDGRNQLWITGTPQERDPRSVLWTRHAAS